MMQSRRDFLIVATATGTLGSIGAPVRAQPSLGEPKGATAITEVFGDGVRLTAVAVEYDRDLRGASLSPASFGVEGRTVTDAFVSKTADPTGRADPERHRYPRGPIGRGRERSPEHLAYCLHDQAHS